MTSRRLLELETAGVGVRRSREEALASLRIAKKLAPHQNGAKRLALRYGEALVCVRHRLDASASIRYTTVELLVERTPVATRRDRLVAVRVGPTERALRATLLSCGASWDSKNRQWLVKRRIAKELGLVDRIVPLKR